MNMSILRSIAVASIHVYSGHRPQLRSTQIRESLSIGTRHGECRREHSNPRPTRLRKRRTVYRGSGRFRAGEVRRRSLCPWVAPRRANTEATAIYSLLSSSDGALWIGTAKQLLRWKSDSIHGYALGGRINSILEDRQQRIWVARSRMPDARGGLCRVVIDHPECMGGDGRMKLPYAEVLSEDVHGNLWIGASNQLMRWHDGSFESYFREQLERYQTVSSVDGIAAAADGSVWVSIPTGGFGLFRMVDGIASKPVLPGFDTAQVRSLFVDREHSLWMATTNDGVYRLSGGRVDHFRSEDGLSSNAVSGFFEDREGNLWLSTSKGLDCFRDSRVITFSTSEGLEADLVSSVLASVDGTVWIGNRKTLDVLQGDKVSGIPIPGRRVTALFQDHAGRLWVGVDEVLTIYDHGRFKKINRPDGSPLGTVIAITEDQDHNVWVSVATGRKLFRIRDLRVEDEFTSEQIPFARFLAADPKGGFWLGLANGSLGHYRSGKIGYFSVAEQRFCIARPDGRCRRVGVGRDPHRSVPLEGW